MQFYHPINYPLGEEVYVYYKVKRNSANIQVEEYECMNHSKLQTFDFPKTTNFMSTQKTNLRHKRNNY